jgi:hypothetical protein
VFDSVLVGVTGEVCDSILYQTCVELGADVSQPTAMAPGSESLTTLVMKPSGPEDSG